MASCAPTRSEMLRRLRSHANTITSPTPLTGVRPQLRHGGVRQWSCGLSTHNKSPISRYEGASLVAPCGLTRRKAPVRDFASTSAKHNAARQKDHENKPRRGRPYTILTIVILGAALLSATTDILGEPFGRSPKGVLNGESFVPFKVVSTERTSPTTFILTVTAQAPHRAENATVARDAWSHGLWSVEIKQPQLQIARNYTPLPPAAPAAGDGPAAEDHQLRFLIRRYDGGEMSTYLSRLGPGDEAWLRGPHLGFDVAAKFGAAGERVVFLAGGTGVAPALQVARHLLSVRQGAGEGRLSMEIIWANRARVDCSGCPRLSHQCGDGGLWKRLGSVAGRSGPRGDRETEDTEHPVVRELRDLQAAYKSRGHELKFRCVADDEAGSISGPDVTRAIERSHTSSPSTAVGMRATEQASCYDHSQKLLQHSTQESDAELKGQGRAGTVAGGCVCGGKSTSGKNLLMISGPDGFVGAYVGPKVWADGAERQGPVGGLVRRLMQKSPEAWRDWLILKQ